MDWKDVAGKVANFAPLLGGILGGPLGGAAGAGVKLLASAFGLTEAETTPDKINQMLQTDPEAAIKLAEIEADNRIELRKIVLEQERLRLADVANARSREVKIVEATGKRDLNLYVLSWLVIVGFFVLLGFMYFTVIPMDNVGPVNQLFGALAAGFGMVLQYFFGSSKSSADKTALLAEKKG
ncbi:MAG: hypothetical protein ABII06_19705 [Pseudomonadota bacterium]